MIGYGNDVVAGPPKDTNGEVSVDLLKKLTGGDTIYASAIYQAGPQE